MEGFRLTAQLTIVGIDAVGPARATARPSWRAPAPCCSAWACRPTRAPTLEVLGAETSYGRTRARSTREAILALCVTHARKEALDLLSREVAPAGTSWSPGTTGSRRRPFVGFALDPPVRLLLPKPALAPTVHWTA